MKAIGVFDSGIGGLTVVKELIRQLPNEDLIYFGDLARVPYGIKSKETVVRFSIEDTLFLLKHNVKLITDDEAYHDNEGDLLPFTDRGLKKRDDLYLLKATTIPAVIVEILFIDNDQEASYLFYPRAHLLIAKAIFRGIEEHIDVLYGRKGEEE